MGFFDFFKKTKSFAKELTEKKEEDDVQRRAKNAATAATKVAIDESVAQANIKYNKPDYNPQTRKQYYDDGSAHHRAIDNAFTDGKIVRDPYSGAKLVKKQQEAKMQFGENWQNHAAEADHIDPLSRFVERVKDNPFLTTDDIREIGNSDDNFQVLSRKLNQGSRDAGKGGSTQEEWADDDTRMKGVADTIESGESGRKVRQRIRDRGKAAESRNDSRAFRRSMENVVGTAHEAGTSGAQYAGTTALTTAGIMNMVSAIKGEKSGAEALADTAKAGGKAAITGYATSGGVTVVTQALSSSSSEFIRALAKNNVPGQVVTAVMATGDTLKKWGNGEITTRECILRLGESGLNYATAGYSFAVGQALIPIPVIGGAIGAMVGSMLTNNLYSNLINKLQQKQLEHEERVRIIAECNAAVKQERAFRAEMEAYLDAYFQDYRSCFNAALSTMHTAYIKGDADGVITGANSITRKLGGQVKYENVNEFKSFLDSNEDDVL